MCINNGCTAKKKRSEKERGCTGSFNNGYTIGAKIFSVRSGIFRAIEGYECVNSGCIQRGKGCECPIEEEGVLIMGIPSEPKSSPYEVVSSERELISLT